MKKQKNIWIIVLVLLIIILFGFISYKSFSEKKVELSFLDVEFKPTFKLSLSKGCITEVNGTLSNLGETTAENIVISCKVIGSGGGDITGTKNIGFIKIKENSHFEMTINNDCPAPYDIECLAVCDNCKYQAYG